MPFGRDASERVRLLAGEDQLLVDHGQPVVEPVEGSAGQPAIDHVGGPAAFTDRARDVGRPVHHVAGREDVREGGLAGRRVGLERAIRVGRDVVREGAGVRRHADRPDDDLARDHELAARDGLGSAAPGCVRRAERHAGAAQAAHRTLLVAEDLGRGDLEAEGHALALGVVGLHVVGRHLLPAAPVGHRDGRRAQAASRPRRVHRDVAAADHDDPLSGQVHRLAELHLAQEVGAAEDAEAILAGNADAGRARGARRQEHRVEAGLLEGGHVPDRAVRGDLHADRPDVLDVALDDLDREAVGRDRHAQEAARLRRGLEDLHARTRAGRAARRR